MSKIRSNFGRESFRRSQARTSIVIVALTVTLVIYTFQPFHLSTQTSRVAILYSYFEKDKLQMENFKYFLTVGYEPFKGRSDVFFFFSLNGPNCTICRSIDLKSSNALFSDYTSNKGMDFGAWGQIMIRIKNAGQYATFSYFIFLNSSTRGPYYPKYYDHSWWTAYTRLIHKEVVAVGSSLVCLPDIDPGGPGPRLESWAFALSSRAASLLINYDVFSDHGNKFGRDGVIVRGEYALSSHILEHGYNIDTLLLKYKGIDWRNRSNWRCNNNIHPSRIGTYDGISQHPLETMFIKTSWGVGEPYAGKYSSWIYKQQLNKGRDLTNGYFDHQGYLNAISAAKSSFPGNMSISMLIL